MAVVVDEAFFSALGKMESVSHISNADIVWFIVGFDIGESSSTLVPRRYVATTLERAVEGLTAGSPLSLEEFEAEIISKLVSPKLTTRKKSR